MRPSYFVANAGLAPAERPRSTVLKSLRILIVVPGDWPDFEVRKLNEKLESIGHRPSVFRADMMLRKDDLLDAVANKSIIFLSISDSARINDVRRTAKRDSIPVHVASYKSADQAVSEILIHT